MKSITKTQNGFTLIELLIALVIFAVGILGVATMQLTSIQGNSKGRQISEASNLAADRIETFLSLDYSDSDLDDDDGDGTNQDANGDGIDDNGGNFGLDDLTNPDGAVDTDGDGVPDDRDADGVADVSWNVAIDHPEQNTKTIKVTVDPPGTGRPVSIEIVKSSL